MLVIPSLIAYVFPYKLVVAPMFVTFIALAFIWLLRAPAEVNAVACFELHGSMEKS